MPSKDSKAKTTGAYRRVEQNIYQEARSEGTVRFKVQVHPFKPVTRTVDAVDVEIGLDWAQGKRLELLRAKRAQPGPRASAAWSPSGPSPAKPFIAASTFQPESHPLDVQLGVILDWYEKNCVPDLSTDNSRAAERSRVRKLKAMFATHTLRSLTKAVLKEWQKARLRGEGGGARSAWRAERNLNAQIVTKDQRRRMRAAARLSAPDRGNSNGAAITMMPPVDGTAALGTPSTQTLRHELRVLRSACKRYFEESQWESLRGWVTNSDVMRWTLPPPALPRRRRISAREEELLLANCHSPMVRHAIRFALSETCRRSEIVLLRWQDVDFENSTLEITRPVGLGKSKTMTRTLPLTPECVALLKEMGPRESGPIFPMTANAISQAFRRAADRAGLYDLRFHDTRREAVSALAEAGVSNEDVMQFTGHTRVDVLEKHYRKPEAKKTAESVARKLENGRRAAGAAAGG